MCGILLLLWFKLYLNLKTIFPSLQLYLSLICLPTCHLRRRLSDLMEEVQFSSLLEKSSLADRARLLSITSPHAAAWISVTPSISQGLHLLPNEFQVAVQWWLGINPSPTSSQDGSLLICPFCPSSTLDTLGHHCVTCRCGGDVTTRHNAPASLNE